MKSWIIFVLAWTTIVYNLVAHMVWSAWKDDNGELKVGYLRGLGAIDFAGGTVVHMVM